MKNTQQTIRTITEIGLFAAIGYVLDELQGIIGKGLFVNGGSIGFAMIAVIIIMIRRGWLSGVLVGLIMGLFDFATGAYILHPAQALLDYILPYAVVGLAGLFLPIYNNTEKKIPALILLVTAGGIFKFLSHYIAGVIFWNNAGEFAWGLGNLSPYLYSLIYNIAYIGPTIVLSIALMILIYKKAPKLLTNQNLLNEKQDNNQGKISTYVLSGVFTAGGAFLFVYYLIDFIKSVYQYQDTYEGGSRTWDVVGFEANGDSMVIFVLGLFLLTLGIFGLIKTTKGTINKSNLMVVLSAISMVSFIYGLARLIRCYVKEKPVGEYWIWIIISAFVCLIAIGVSIMFKSAASNHSDEQEVEHSDL